MANSIDPSQLNPDDLEVIDPSKVDMSDFEVLHKPSKKALAQAQVDKSTQGKALAMSTAQGATMGLLDELMGLGGVAGYKAGSEPGLESTHPQVQAILNKIEQSRPSAGQVYEQGRDEARQEYKQLKEENPGTTFAGELLGSALTGKALSGISPGIKNTLSSPVKGGALMGGATAFGTSEGQTARDVALDTGIGAVEGGALGKLASVILPSGSSTASDSPLIRQGKLAFKEGLEGRKFTGDAAKNRIIESQTGKVGNIVNQLDTAESTIGKLLRKSVESVKAPINAADNINLSSAADDIINVIDNDPLALTGRFKREVLEGLSKLKSNELTPAELFDLKGRVLTELKKTDKYAQLGNEFYHSANESLNKIPEFAKYNAGFKALREGGSEALLNRGVPGEFVEKTKGATNEADKNIFNVVKDLTEKSALHGTESTKATATLQQFKKGLEDLATNKPEILKESGLQPDKILKDISELSDMQAVYRYIRQNKLDQGNILSTIMHFTGRGKLFEGANLAGRAVGAVGGVVGKADKSVTANMSKALYSLDNNALNEIASRVQQSKPLESLGKALSSAVADNNVARKNAVLFSLLQNPQAREMLEGYGQEPVTMPEPEKK